MHHSVSEKSWCLFKQICIKWQQKNNFYKIILLSFLTHIILINTVILVSTMQVLHKCLGFLSNNNFRNKIGKKAKKLKMKKASIYERMIILPLIHKKGINGYILLVWKGKILLDNVTEMHFRQHQFWFKNANFSITNYYRKKKKNIKKLN